MSTIIDLLRDKTFLVIVVVFALFSVGAVYAIIAERESCEALGGRIVSKSSTGLGVGIASGGGVAVVPTFGSVSFCISSDGRILD